MRWAVLLVASLMAIAARPAAGLEKLRIAYPSVSVTLTPLWIAKDLGFFRAEGLEVETTFISGATPTVQALLAGDIQAGVGVGAPPVITAILQGGDLTIAAVPGNRLDNVLVSRTPVRTPAELAGKRFGISARGAPAEVVTRIALQRLGVDPDRVVMVAVGGAPQRRAAMSAGLIDATVLSSAEFVQEQGQVHLVLDLAKAGLDFPYQTLVVTKQFATQNRPLVLGMIRALVKALRFMRANREESVRIAAQWTKTADLDRIQRQWQHIAFELWQEIPRPSESGFRLVVETLGDRHPRLATLRLSDVFDASFVEELERSGFFASR